MQAINEEIFFLIFQFTHRFLVLDWVIIFFASILPFIVGGLVFVHALRLHDVRKEGREILWLFGPSFVAYAISVFIKFLTHNPRPYAFFDTVVPLIHETDPYGSFPSSHTIFFTALGISFFFRAPKWGKWYILAAVMIGVARIAAGVHWPADVLAGFFLGVIVAYIGHLLEEKFFKNSKQNL